MDNTDKKNLLNRVQDYLDTRKGRILLNYFYSWGAAIVILGTLFKLTHISGANLMLFIGMGTEVLVFFISGFEKPFIPNKDGLQEDDYFEGEEEEVKVIPSESHAVRHEAPAISIVRNTIVQEAKSQVNQDNAVAQEGSSLNIDGVEQITQDYLDRLRSLTDKMITICNQSDKIARSTEEIDTLGRNLISINTFYEMHLRSVSSQMENIDQVNEQTRRMVEQIEELNRVYARMVEAMKVNSHIGNTEKV
jgi:gliding motility-associated protein GldL